MKTKTVLSALAMLASFVVIVARPAPSAAVNPPKKNILFILTDDQTKDGIEHMPYLQSIKPQFWQFSNAYISTPKCCPSRATLLSGQYPWHNGVFDSGDAPNFDFCTDIGAWLQAAGYKTAIVGKVNNLWPYNSHTVCGFDRTVGLNLDDDSGMGAYYDYDLWVDGNLEQHRNGVYAPDYSTKVLSDYGRQFMLDQSAAGNPWFLFWSFKAPHSPFSPEDHYASTFSRNDIIYSDSFLRIPGNAPAWMRCRNTPSQDKVDDERLNSWRTLLSVDDAIKDAFTQLDMSNTVVVFMTDNGLALGEHNGDDQKICPEVECISTPLWIMYPGGAAPQNSQKLISNVDIPITLAEIAGASPLRDQDGDSFKQLLDSGSQPNWKPYGLLFHWPGGGGGSPQCAQIPQYWAAISKVNGVYWHYIKYPGLPDKELYNLGADPSEMTNQYGVAPYASVQQTMQNNLSALKTAAGAP